MGSRKREDDELGAKGSSVLRRLAVRHGATWGTHLYFECRAAVSDTNSNPPMCETEFEPLTGGSYHEYT